MLQRIYGTSFPKKAQLEEHLYMLEEAKKRDHRKLGKELELFMFSEEAPGMPFYLPKGMMVRTALEEFSRGLQREREYSEVRTPLMMNNRLWEQSGHYDHYKDEMYFTDVDENKFALKPMNCPGHMMIYKNSLHSYRELPIRIAEYGQVHRHEFSGALNGMMRVRTFCQDDAHLFVLPEQIEEEIGRVLALIDHIYKVFGFEYKVELSTRPADYMGAESLWDQAESALQKVLEKRGIPYRVNTGDGAFTGRRSTFIFWTRSREAGNAEQFSWISRCRRSSTCLISEKMARSTGLSLFTVRFMAPLTGSWVFSLSITAGHFRYGWPLCRPNCCLCPSILPITLMR